MMSFQYERARLPPQEPRETPGTQGKALPQITGQLCRGILLLTVLGSPRYLVGISGAAPRGRGRRATRTRSSIAPLPLLSLLPPTADPWMAGTLVLQQGREQKEAEALNHHTPSAHPHPSRKPLGRMW